MLKSRVQQCVPTPSVVDNGGHFKGYNPNKLTPPPLRIYSDELFGDKQSTIDARGNTIHQLKSFNIEKMYNENELKASISSDSNGFTISKDAFRRAVIIALERRLFYIPSFKIYIGLVALYNYDPPSCAVQSNVLLQLVK
ncbi:hypothetical protein E3N88_33641 [Mikania micrantha]|uniref:Uncharacterized protein n=1 Tax=Mikania micrantha TaxID=192012 RepID=A0A5N6MC38_9ASTR|nr:hypothetical protein E3N88_33641 [Mikania micrantha]